MRVNPKHAKAFRTSDRILNGIVAYNQYGGYLIPQSSLHRPAAQEVMSGRVYEPDTIKFIMENCGSGDIIHAGTYFGDFLPALSSALSNGSEIWAFEPNPENFKCAQITILINDIKNVQLMNAGLGESESTAKMLIESDRGESLGGASRILRQEEKGKVININVVRIDDVVPVDRKISILHLDVEGFEKEALQGALETIKRNKPVLILEDNNNIISSNWFSENLISLGYEINAKLHNNTILRI